MKSGGASMLNLKLDNWQKKFKETKGDKILCTGRQVGKSVICAIDCMEYAINNKNKFILMIAPTERQAYELFDKTLHFLMLEHPQKIIKRKQLTNKTRITLKNKTVIRCLPTGTAGLGIRGFTVDRLYVDEAARIPEEVWGAVTPMLLTTGGDTILISTPFGAQGYFYDVWRNKDNAFKSFARFSINSEEVIENRPISQTWTKQQREYALAHLNQEKKRMSRRRYAQEYLGEFIEDLHRWFSDKLIAEICVLKRPAIFTRSDNYYLGVDIARMGEDEGTFEILKKINNDNIIQVENIVTRKKLTYETEEKILELDKKYDFQKIFIDAGSGTLGVSIFDHLLKEDQTKRKIEAINNRARPMNRDGTRSARLLKEDLYDNLRALMEQKRIKLLDDEDLIESLRSIQYEYITDQHKPTKLVIFGDYSHIVEGLIRAAWCVKYKDLSIWVRSIRI